MWSDTEYALAAEPADLNGGLGRVLVVSPHIDDAVTGCADLLGCNPGSLVVTVFAGLRPAELHGAHADRGVIEAADGALAARREEDLLGLFLLEASPVWLDFLDAHPGRRPRLAAIGGALADAVARHSPDSVVFPLGLEAEAHRLVAEACLSLCAGSPDRRWIAYADACGHASPRAAEPRQRELSARGFVLDPLAAPRVSARKRHAVDCYSRLQACGGSGEPLHEALFAPEQYWQIRPQD